MHSSAKATRAPLGAAAHIALAAATAIVVLVWGYFRLATLSDDLPLHYGAAEHLARTWTAGSRPPLAYALALAAGRPIHSVLTGLNIVVCVSVFGAYLLLLEAYAAACGSLLGLGLTAALWAAGVDRRAVIGADGFEYLLYPQVVGQLLLYLYVFWLCRGERRWTIELAVSAIAVGACGWVDGMTALEIAGAWLWRQFDAGRGPSISVAWLSRTAVGAATLALLLALPPYAGGVVDAPRGGALEGYAFPGATLSLAVALLAAAVFLGRSETPSWGSRFLATAGGSVGLSAVLQETALMMGLAHGPLAEQRHIFAVFTLLAVILGALAGSASTTRSPWRIPRPLLAAGPPLAAAAATIGLAPHPSVGLQRFVGYERSVTNAVAHRLLPADTLGSIESRNQDFPSNLNRAVSQVDLGGGAAPARYALVHQGHEIINPRCVRANLGFEDMRVVSPQCIVDSVLDIDPGQTMEMSKLKVRPPQFVSGWNPKEDPGFWSDGPKAVIRFRTTPTPNPITFRLNVAALLEKPLMRRRVTATVKGHVLGTWTFDEKNPAGEMRIDIPRVLAPDGRVELDLDLPDLTPGQGRGIFVRAASVDLGNLARPGYALSLADTQIKPAFLAQGWSGKEGNGVWSEGKASTMALDVGSTRGDVMVTIGGAAWIPDPGYVQHVTVSTDAGLLARWTLDAQHGSGEHAVIVPKAAIHDGLVTLHFAFPDATSPAQQKKSSDSRVLAFFVTSVAVADTAPETAHASP